MKFKLTKPRKIISWDYSFLITLPKIWLEHHKIGKGDYLDMEVNDDGFLILKPIIEDKNETKKTE